MELPKDWYYLGSLLSAFGVRDSVTFHLICVHIDLAWVGLLSYDPFGEELFTPLTIHVLLVLLLIKLFPVLPFLGLAYFLLLDCS